MHRKLLVPALCLVAGVGALRCSDADDAGPGTKPAAAREPACPIDLAPHLATAAGLATASVVTEEADLIGGQAADGRTGDFLLANERIRAIVQGSDRAPLPNPYGGNLVDGDVIRAEGAPGRDVLGEIAPFYNFGRTTDPESPDDVWILRDGSDGLGAVIAVDGRDTQNDWLNVGGMLSGLLGGAPLGVDSEEALPVRISSYHLLLPGAAHVRTITAFCNDGEEAIALAVGDLIDSGGSVEAFNPNIGWGARSLPVDAPFLAFEGDGAAYALVPGDGGQKNQALTVSGVSGTLQGSKNLFDFVGNVDPDDPPQGALVVPAGGSASYERSVVFGSTLGDVTAEIFALRGDATGRVEGQVANGPGARIALVSEGRTQTVLTADGEGRFAASVPEGRYEISASLPGRVSPVSTIDITSTSPARAELSLQQTGVLRVQVTTLAGEPMPGRVHVLCAGACASPRADERLYREVEEWPEDLAAIAYADMSGVASFELPPGNFEVLAARGAEYDTFPTDWPDTGHGFPVTVTAGETAEVTAPLARVVDTTGWISADFHVHGVDSHDSPVPNRERVISFLGSGVEVLVMTDHDVVTDLSPYVDELGAGSALATVVGTEITMFDYGHVNAFPLPADAAPIDWAGGRGPSLSPGQIFAEASAAGAEVVHLNHPRGSFGMFDALRLDTASGATHADPAFFRIAPNGNDPTLDSGLFSRDFTALEILNGFQQKQFQAVFNDWFTFLAQGFVVTGTAVSDTHRLVTNGPGSPRSWVKLPNDNPADVDVAGLAAAINAGRVVGSTAPFVEVTARAGSATAGPGETLATEGGTVELQVTVQSPRWAGFNRIEVYSHRAGTEATNGQWNDRLPADAVALDAAGSPARLVVDPADVAHAAPGFEGGEDHPVLRVEHTFTLQPAADTFYVVLVRALTEGLEDGEVAPPSFDPIAFDEDGDARALAFTNPVLVDVDGGGYDRFPLPLVAPSVRLPASRSGALPTEAAFLEAWREMAHQH